MIRSTSKENPLGLEIVTDPEEFAKAREQDDRFRRNLRWFEAHAREIYPGHRGKCYCVAGEELFAADTPEEAIRLAKAAHPQDDGLFTGYVPRVKMERIYASKRILASL